MTVVKNRQDHPSGNPSRSNVQLVGLLAPYWLLGGIGPFCASDGENGVGGGRQMHILHAVDSGSGGSEGQGLSAIGVEHDDLVGILGDRGGGAGFLALDDNGLFANDFVNLGLEGRNFRFNRFIESGDFRLDGGIESGNFAVDALIESGDVGSDDFVKGGDFAGNAGFKSGNFALDGGIESGNLRGDASVERGDFAIYIGLDGGGRHRSARSTGGAIQNGLNGENAAEAVPAGAGPGIVDTILVGIAVNGLLDVVDIANSEAFGARSRKVCNGVDGALETIYACYSGIGICFCGFKSIIHCFRGCGSFAGSAKSGGVSGTVVVGKLHYASMSVGTRNDGSSFNGIQCGNDVFCNVRPRTQLVLVGNVDSSSHMC